MPNINSTPVYKMPIDIDAFIIDCVDRILLTAPSYTEFTIDGMNKPYDPVFSRLSTDIRKTLKMFGYIDAEPNRSRVRLSSKGIEVKEAGGHKIYHASQKELKQQQANFYNNIALVVHELTKQGVAQTIIAEFFFNQSEEVTQSSFLKFLTDKSADLAVALSTPAIADFLHTLPNK